MSNKNSALKGKVSGGDVAVKDIGPRGMITVRGDFNDDAFCGALRRISGLDMPGMGQVVSAGDVALAWMSPDELLLMTPYETAGDALSKLNAALAGMHFLAEDVSDARALIRVEGPFASEVIAKLAPVDVRPESFAVGRFRRTRLGQVAAAFWRSADDSYDVICFRSVGDYTFKLLATSANAGPVGVH